MNLPLKVRLTLLYVGLVTVLGAGWAAVVVALARRSGLSDDAAGRLTITMVLTGLVALTLAALGGWLLARGALRPVARMTATAARIGIDALDERVPVPRGTDELSALAGTLNDMLGRLETGVRDKRRLVANASHELQTPLAVMCAELDVSLAEHTLPPDALEVLESTREEAGRMVRIVRNLLTLARFEEGSLRLMQVKTDLRQIASDSGESLATLAREQHVTIALEGESAPVLGDPEYLRLVIDNLLENAVKYAGAGAAITLEAGQIDGESFVSVSDTGVGIPPNALERIFDPFYRIDATRGREGGGSGLGLAISREIVHSHGGRLEAESELGRGTRFTLLMPSRRALS